MIYICLGYFFLYTIEYIVFIPERSLVFRLDVEPPITENMQLILTYTACPRNAIVTASLFMQTPQNSCNSIT